MTEFEIPKAIPSYEGRELAHGFESVVYKSQEGYVVKVPNTNRFLNQHDRGEKIGEWIASEKHGRELERENLLAELVLKDRLINSWFFFGQQVEGISGATYLRVQPDVSEKRVEGDFMLWSTLSNEAKQAIIKDPAMQEEVQDMMWAFKAYHYFLGYPFDMKEDNIVYEATKKKFYFLEAGFPSEMKKIVEDAHYLPEVFSIPLRIALVEMMQQRLNGPFLAIGEAIVTPEQKAMLDKKYNLPSDLDYAAMVRDMLQLYEVKKLEYEKSL